MDYRWRCENVAANGTTYTTTGTTYRRYTVVGNCVTATFTGPGEPGTLIGGTIAVGTPPGGARVTVLTPWDDPCNLGYVDFSQPGADWP